MPRATQGRPRGSASCPTFQRHLRCALLLEARITDTSAHVGLLFWGCRVRRTVLDFRNVYPENISRTQKRSGCYACYEDQIMQRAYTAVISIHQRCRYQGPCGNHTDLNRKQRVGCATTVHGQPHGKLGEHSSRAPWPVFEEIVFWAIPETSPGHRRDSNLLHDFPSLVDKTTLLFVRFFFLDPSPRKPPHNTRGSSHIYHLPHACAMRALR